MSPDSSPAIGESDLLPLRLVVVGEPPARDLVERQVRASFTCATLESVRRVSALPEALVRQQPHCVVAVSPLPEGDEESLVRTVLDLSSSTAVILVGASSAVERRVASIRAGADDYLPSDRLQDLGSVVRTALARRAQAADREHHLEELRRSAERYAIAADVADEGVWDWDLDRRDIYFSPRWKAMLDFEQGEIGCTPEEWLSLAHPEDAPRVASELITALAGAEKQLDLEYRIQTKDGVYRRVRSRAAILRHADGKAARVVGTQVDITQMRAAEGKILHDAFHDDLTGLPNRRLFLDRLAQRIARARRTQSYSFAVLVVNTDRFRVVNDGFGQLMGDVLLMDLGRRLKGSVREVDSVARLWGDVFAILLEEVRGVKEAVQVAERALRCVQPPFRLNDREIFVSVSIGIVFGEASHAQPDELLRDADAAVSQARRLGRGRFAVLEPESRERSAAERELETELRGALERGELRVHYQPTVSLRTDALLGFEALVRWEHPKRGLLRPADFVPLAEETGLIVPIGRWVLEEACRFIRSFQDRFPQLASFTVSVNLSARQFSNERLVEETEEALLLAQVDPRRLRLEITETMAMEDPVGTAAKLQRLRRLGISVDIDDFGTGHSSLSHIHQLPVDALKIDRSFVSRLHEKAEDVELVRMIVTLAASIRAEVIAEGVDNADQVKVLRRVGCDQAQGYFFARPMDADRAMTWAKERAASV